MASGAETWNSFYFRDGGVSLAFRVVNDDAFGVPWDLVSNLAQSFLERAQMGQVSVFTGQVTGGGGKVIEVALEIGQNIMDSASEIHGG